MITDTTARAHTDVAAAAPNPSDDVEEILAAESVTAAFQPIVELATGEVVGYEALARGPRGSALHAPDRLFGAAREARLLAELDRLCRRTALDAARRAGLRAPFRLFLNSEPETLDLWTADDMGAEAATAVVPVVLELTERALTARPAELLRAIGCLRRRGWGIALDDVGADPASLALLPLVRPDVIKLDLRLIQQRPTRHAAATMNAVNAEAERSGALVLAEGVETEEHVRAARAFGATLAQGWLLGRPEPLPGRLPDPPSRPVVVAGQRRVAAAGRTPFEIVRAVRGPQAADKALLIEVSRQLEEQARSAGETAVVLSTFQHQRYLTPATCRRYSALAATTAFAAVLGEEVLPEPVPGVRGAVLEPGDPVCGEWDVVVLGPHFAAALVARDLGDTGPERSRRFEYALTHDRDLVVAAADSLMARIHPRLSVPVLPHQRPD